jgi:hypothetical protein
MPLAKIHVVEGRYDEARIAKVSVTGHWPRRTAAGCQRIIPTTIFFLTWRARSVPAGVAP